MNPEIANEANDMPNAIFAPSPRLKSPRNRALSRRLEDLMKVRLDTQPHVGCAGSLTSNFEFYSLLQSFKRAVCRSPVR